MGLKSQRIADLEAQLQLLAEDRDQSRAAHEAEHGRRLEAVATSEDLAGKLEQARTAIALLTRGLDEARGSIAEQRDAHAAAVDQHQRRHAEQLGKRDDNIRRELVTVEAAVWVLVVDKLRPPLERRGCCPEEGAHGLAYVAAAATALDEERASPAAAKETEALRARIARLEGKAP